MSSTAPEMTPSAPVEKAVFSAQLRPVLQMLAAARGMTSLEELADAAGIARATFYDRLKKGNFSAVDFANIALALRVSVDTLYLSAEELVAAFRTGSFATWLTSLPEPTGQGTLLSDELEPFDFYTRPSLSSV